MSQPCVSEATHAYHAHKATIMILISRGFSCAKSPAVWPEAQHTSCQQASKHRMMHPQRGNFQLSAEAIKLHQQTPKQLLSLADYIDLSVCTFQADVTFHSSSLYL